MDGANFMGKQTNKKFCANIDFVFFCFELSKMCPNVLWFTCWPAKIMNVLFCADTASILRFCKNIFIVFTKYLKIDFFRKIKFLLLFRMIIESCFFVETKTRCFLCYDNYSYSIWELIDYQINYKIKSVLCFKFMT